MNFFIIIFICCQILKINAWSIYHYENRNVETNEIDGNPEPPKEKFNLIFPGTKWCGAGNIATDYNDLGKYKETDSCCRTHDYCSDAIEAGHSKHNLTNNSFYTRLNCDCDRKFYNCLKSSSETPAKQVGFTYFNVLGTQCYMKDYPIVKCLHYNSFLKNRCEKYELDHTLPKKWQWFDVPIY